MSDVLFRKVDSLDTIAVVEGLAREIWPEYYAPIIGPAQVAYMLDKFQSASAISGQIREGYQYRIIVSLGVPSGYLAFVPDCDRQELFLSKLYVSSSCRGAGLGRRSMDFIVAEARENGLIKIALTVNKENLSSIRFYKAMGFRAVLSVRQDIGSGFFMDDWRMEKQIS